MSELLHVRPTSALLDVVDRDRGNIESFSQQNCALIGRADSQNLLSGQFRQWRTSYVLRMSDRLKMIWTHTGRLFAQMVKFKKTLRNRNSHLFIQGAVCADHFPHDRRFLMSPLVHRTSSSDPARRIVSSVFFSPHVRE